MIIDDIKVPHNFINLKGQRFGMLLLEQLIRSESGVLKWVCKCGCGNTKISNHRDIRVGDVHSCGCNKGKLVSLKKVSHAQSKTAEYRAWKRIKSRVCNKNNLS